MLLFRRIPQYICMTYPDKENNKIFVGVLPGSLEEAEEFFKSSFCEQFKVNAIQIEETGDLDFGGSKTKDYAVKPTVSAENATYQSTPGQMLPKIQSGKTIETRSNPNRKPNAPASSMEIGGKIATVGGIVKDLNSGELYAITAQHAFSNRDTGFQSGECNTSCTIEVNNNSVDSKMKPEVQSCNISNRYLGIFGTLEDDDSSNHAPALDIAVLPLIDRFKIGEEVMPFFIHNSSHVELRTYAEPAENMKGKQVQQQGGKSGLVYGEIILPKFDVYAKGRWLGEDGFLVASNDMIFAAQGDSGSLIIDDLRSGCTSAVAYGVLFLVETNCRRKSLSTGEAYKAIAWCTRLNHGFDALRSKAGLELDFIILRNMEQLQPVENTRKKPISIHLSHQDLSPKSKQEQFFNYITQMAGSNTNSSSSLFESNLDSNAFGIFARTKSDPSSLHFKVKIIGNTVSEDDLNDHLKYRTTSDSAAVMHRVNTNTKMKNEQMSRFAKFKTWLKKLKPVKKSSRSSQS